MKISDSLVYTETTELNDLNDLNYLDYWALCKPKVVLLMLITAWAGMFLAGYSEGIFNGMTQASIASFGIACVSAASAVMNHLIDRRLDAKMTRTSKRPMPNQRISVKQAVYFASALCLTGIVVLMLGVNYLTAGLTGLTGIGYAAVYTAWLKHKTPQNIVIGGLTGAMPPLLGWASMSNTITPEALVLVLIIFTWTPPHFWALAIYREQDYARAGIPMLTVTHGVQFTRWFIFLYVILLSLVCFLPYLIQMSGLLYLLTAFSLNVYFIKQVYDLMHQQIQSEILVKAAKLFQFSIIYLGCLFFSLIMDRVYYYDF
jgi:protoheme IX farnesyltransferase